MIDVDNLMHLRICEKCNVVYMPKFQKGCDYEQTLYAINNRYCERCEEIKK